MSKPINTAIRVMRQMTEQERHNRELVDLHEGWRARERELLAHIERLERQLNQCRELMECNDPTNAAAIFGVRNEG